MINALTDVLKLDFTRWIMRVFWLFPLRHKQIFFSAYEGKQYSCNPRVLYERILSDSRFSDYSIVWELNTVHNSLIIKNLPVKIVRHNSLSYFLEILRSEYIVTNTGVSARIPLRKRQININTWHGGGAFKRVGYAVSSTSEYELKALSIAMNQTDYFVSSSKKFTEVMIDSIKLEPQKFFCSGMPRNDVFFSRPKMKKINALVRKQLEIDDNQYMVLYAPTYKGIVVGQDTTSSIILNVEKLKLILQKKVGKEVKICIRMHYFNHNHICNSDVIDVNNYPDMQDLLVSSDMLITDYSSSIWDFALTGKPCLLYCPDLAEYNLERGFYTNPDTWPGILCDNENALWDNIQKFDFCNYEKQVKDYLKSYSCYDCGTATEQILELLC